MKLKSKYQKREIALFYKMSILKKKYGNKLPGK